MCASELSAQAPTELQKRQQLVLNLSTALSQVSSTNTPVTVTIPSGLSLLGNTGQCFNLDNSVLHYVSSDRTRLEMTLRSEGEMDIPEFAHDFVCDLNQFISTSLSGNYKNNWQVDKYGQLQPQSDYNFDANCAANATQKFWMIDGDVAYGSNNVQLNEQIAGTWWRPQRTYGKGALFIGISPSNSGTISYQKLFPLDLIASDDPDDAWIGRRVDNSSWQIEMKRSHVKMKVDYSYYDRIDCNDNFNDDINGNGVNDEYDDTFDDEVSLCYEYIDISSSDLAFQPYTKRLTGLEVIARMQDYPSNECPQGGSASVAALSDRAELKLIIHYIEGGASNSITCVQTFDDVAGPDVNNQSLWDRLNWDQGRLWGEFDIDENGVLYFETTTSCSGTPSSTEKFAVIKLRDRTVPADLCEMVLASGGDFEVDDMTGEIVYAYSSGGNTLKEQIFCYGFCQPLSGYTTYSNVLAASAQTFQDVWTYDPEAHGSWDNGANFGYRTTESGFVDPYKGLPDNPFQRAELGKWRPDNAYVYRADVKSGVGSNRVYDAAGVFLDDAGSPVDAFRQFNWRNPADNPSEWLNPVTIVQYAPTGESVEEHNIIDIYSTAQLAHEESVPRLVAQNASYNSVDFESFEDRTWWGDWDNNGTYNWYGNRQENTAHSGHYSMILNSDGGYVGVPLVSVELTSQIRDEGVLLKLWVKHTNNESALYNGLLRSPIEVRILAEDEDQNVTWSQEYSNLASSTYNTLDPDLIHKVAKTGEWSLFQLVVTSFGSAQVGDKLSFSFRNNFKTINNQVIYNEQVWVDDIRVQPLNSAMTCFVYDYNTLRLIAQFDDQHFGVFSRYNGEGNLVSVLRETERGIVTVSESQAWVMSQLRPSAGGSTTAPIGNPFSSSYTGANSGSFGSSAGSNNNFDILNLRIGPDGPTVQLGDGSKLPLSDFSTLLDFKTDHSEVNLEKLKEFAPTLSDAERVKVIGKLQRLDNELGEAEAALQRANRTDSAEIIDRINDIQKKRARILKTELGLEDDEVDQLYQELSGGRERAEEER
ncbi:MAG: hypothetical protein AB7H80_07145 [Candidatus Kapaibacterium sp.]